MKRPKVCLVTTSLLVVKFFLLPHIRALSAVYDLTLVANVEDPDFLARLKLPIRVVHIPINRKISLVQDLKALVLLTKFFLNEKFDVVHTVAPKAGIVGILSGWLSRVPKRLHIFQGEVWTTHVGVMRFILRNVDRLIALLATNILVVSQSEREFLIQEKIISAMKSVVLGKGSISGVDMSRFKFDPVKGNSMREGLGINSEAIVFLFVGRLNLDKGILDLFTAFAQLDHLKFKNAHLVVVGPDEENILERRLKLSSEVAAKVHILPYTDRPEDFMTMANVLVLPSYREGFGVVIIEAAAAKVPSVGSRIYGITDAIDENQTGILFTAGDPKDLASKLTYFLENEVSRLEMGNAAFLRCKENFSQETVINQSLNFYAEMLSQ